MRFTACNTTYASAVHTEKGITILGNPRPNKKDNIQITIKLKMKIKDTIKNTTREVIESSGYAMGVPGKISTHYPIEINIEKN